MITDLVIGIFYALYDGLIALAPTMPEKPMAFTYVNVFLWHSNFFLPIEQFEAFLPVMVLTFSALAGWRAIRYLLPGG